MSPILPLPLGRWLYRRSTVQPHTVASGVLQCAHRQRKAAGKYLSRRLLCAVQFVDQTSCTMMVAKTLRLPQSFQDEAIGSPFHTSLFRVVPCASRIVKSMRQGGVK